jgi:hypothetical protein
VIGIIGLGLVLAGFFAAINFLFRQFTCVFIRKRRPRALLPLESAAYAAVGLRAKTPSSTSSQSTATPSTATPTQFSPSFPATNLRAPINDSLVSPPASAMGSPENSSEPATSPVKPNPSGEGDQFESLPPTLRQRLEVIHQVWSVAPLLFRALLEESGSWHDVAGTYQGERWAGVFDGYVARVHWYAVVDLGSNLVLGILVGMTPPLTCYQSGLIQVIAQAIVFFCQLAMRPNTVPLFHFFLSLVTGLTALSALCGFLAIYILDGEGRVGTSASLLTAAITLAGAATALMTVVTAMDLARFLWPILRDLFYDRLMRRLGKRQAVQRSISPTDRSMSPADSNTVPLLNGGSDVGGDPFNTHTPLTPDMILFPRTAVGNAAAAAGDDWLVRFATEAVGARSPSQDLLLNGGGETEATADTELRAVEIPADPGAGRYAHVALDDDIDVEALFAPAAQEEVAAPKPRHKRDAIEIEMLRRELKARLDHRASGSGGAAAPAAVVHVDQQQDDEVFSRASSSAARDLL